MKNKQEWIDIFREKANEILDSIEVNKIGKKVASKKINNGLKDFEKEAVNNVKFKHTSSIGNENLLNEILLITYTSNLVMLEFRNKVWEYEYMAFSRRIGELWEPFCKLTFEYPINDLKLIEPPTFKDIKNNIKKSSTDFINELELDENTKTELLEYYDIPWSFVDSGGIKLELDLHFNQDGINYNCDFKSGFSSNEKGNTNRLLLVASIYSILGEQERTLLFVRQEEDDNNNYLITLKNSQKWGVFCAKDCYEVMKKFTGFDLKSWLDENAKWLEDMDSELKEHLEKNDMIKYLTW